MVHIVNVPQQLYLIKRAWFWFARAMTKSMMIGSFRKAAYSFPDFILKNREKRGIYNLGQDMHWSLFRFIGEDSEINLNTAEPEFKKYEWVTLDEAVERVVDFKKEVYAKMAKVFKPYIG